MVGKHLHSGAWEQLFWKSVRFSKPSQRKNSNNTRNDAKNWQPGLHRFETFCTPKETITSRKGKTRESEQVLCQLHSSWDTIQTINRLVNGTHSSQMKTYKWSINTPVRVFYPSQQGTSSKNSLGTLSQPSIKKQENECGHGRQLCSSLGSGIRPWQPRWKSVRCSFPSAVKTRNTNLSHTQKHLHV